MDLQEWPSSTNRHGWELCIDGARVARTAALRKALVNCGLITEVMLLPTVRVVNQNWSRTPGCD